MELKDFISETLVQIIEGCDDANQRVHNENGKFEEDKKLVNPQIMGADSPIKNVDFDIALTVSDTGQKSGEAGISVLSSLKLAGKSEDTHFIRNVSRVKFQVPVRLK